ncbi:uncharacterized protein LACBIDRAFT_327003 [Laccaria bicolor S238N-H82]|uniref:Predicted protein n=1 Tax=Laccaria bicolor (strain S238N-H82 / ATCC MYA-4686) TaxID=486041 RepID=B0DAD1_LACBS|nr:uncharacterized protein LACBIDRAFT_327003 [Laccaria bicolor S238N-H82]EDR08511.1 predicted protein [Laccaria bicolor S238N-H82]|eukprot:XP_001880736.1 predicted protein [Laccaria bicolor S238N-H82]
MYGTYSQQLTNNPFINASDPTHPSSRFPDISSPVDPNSQYTSWDDSSVLQQQQPAHYQPQQQPQYAAGGYFSPPLTPGSQYPVGGTAFQPTSSFGQQLGAHISGTSYGYLNGQQQQQQQQPQSGYYPAPQQQLQPNNQGYLAQFDPYGPLAQGWEGASQSQTQQPSGSHISTPLAGGGGGLSASGDPHPRDYIRTHKAEIESWDSYAWKQLINTFEALKKAWESRKMELAGRVEQLKMQMQYGGYYQAQIQQEGSRLYGLLKDAESHFGGCSEISFEPLLISSFKDSVAASTFQMEEVFKGYRQSGDLSSKRRVREATNAALQSLPEWPQPYQ